MSNEQKELLDEVFLNYWKKVSVNNEKDCLVKQEEGSFLKEVRVLYQREFINKCKTDPEFSERWGLKIEERELTWDERHELAETKYQIDDVDDVLDKEGVPTRAISLMWNQRSVDTLLGLPFNIASYGLLLEIIAKEVNMVPDELIGNLGDTHLYLNHLEQAKEQIGREPYELPTLKIEHSSLDPVELVYKLENYQSHPTIKAPLSN